MNAKEFYAALAKLKQAGWEVKVNDKGWVRLKNTQGGGSRFSHTPMTAVCLSRGQGDFHWLRDQNAGIALGLSKGLAPRINKATFGKTSFGRGILCRSLDIKGCG